LVAVRFAATLPATFFVTAVSSMATLRRDGFFLGGVRFAVGRLVSFFGAAFRDDCFAVLLAASPLAASFAALALRCDDLCFAAERSVFAPPLPFCLAAASRAVAPRDRELFFATAAFLRRLALLVAVFLALVFRDSPTFDVIFFALALLPARFGDRARRAPASVELLLRESFAAT
jgi:hypothetical protein